MSLHKYYRFVPSLYVLEGLPFSLVTSVAVILFKNLHISNISIAFYTSLFVVPWLLKPLYAPLMERMHSKRTLLLSTSWAMAILILLLALALSSPNFFYFSIPLFFALAFVSSCYDMNADNLYITELNKQAQARFIGIRTISYHLGRLLVQGGIVMIASWLFMHMNIKNSWQLAFIILAMFISMLTIYHYFTLPKDSRTTTLPFSISKIIANYRNVMHEFTRIPCLIAIIIFILFYNFSENQLSKIVPLFLLDNHNHGGLGLNTSDVGLLVGGVGVIGMLVGIFVSGFLLSRFSLAKLLLPFTLFTCITNLGYLLLSLNFWENITPIAFIIALAQFSFGLSNGAYMLFLLQSFGKSDFSMSVYAIGTGLMGLGALLGGTISGYIQYLLGYPLFFAWIVFTGLIMIFYCHYLLSKEIIRDENHARF